MPAMCLSQLDVSPSEINESAVMEYRKSRLEGKKQTKASCRVNVLLSQAAGVCVWG